jgi:tetratricopeptide (TPR) repeat protein
MMEETIAMCPENPMGYMQLGWVYRQDVWLGSAKSLQETLEKSVELARKALAIDDSMAGAHALLCAYLLNKGDFDRAIAEGERTVALDPNDGFALNIYGQSLRFACRPEEAIPLYQKGIRLNPFGAGYIYPNLANVLRMTGRFEEAISTFKKGIGFSPNNIVAHIGLVVTYTMMGRENEARVEAAEVLRINPKFSVDRFAKTIFYKDPSEKDKTIDALRKAGLK